MTADRTILFKDRIPEIYVALIKITHPLLDEPVRACTDSSDITSNGELYLKAFVNIVLPTRMEEGQRARLSVANVDRRIGLAARTLLTPATVLFSLIRTSAPDTVEIQYPPMKMTNISGDASQVSGELREQLNMQDPWPKVRATKTTAPGIFV